MYSLIFDSEGKLAFKEMIKDRSGLISVFIKRAATRSVILRVWDIPTRLHRWKTIHLCTACPVVKVRIIEDSEKIPRPVSF